MESVAGCRSQAGPGAPVFREGRRNFLVPVAGRCARSRLHMGSTSIKQFSRFSMPFQWHKGLFYASFASILTAVFGRQFLVNCQVRGELLVIHGGTRRDTENCFLSAEGRGEYSSGLWLGLGTGVCAETGQGRTWLGEGMRWAGRKGAGGEYAFRHSMARRFCNCLAPFWLRGELVRRCAGVGPAGVKAGAFPGLRLYASWFRCWSGPRPRPFPRLLPRFRRSRPSLRLGAEREPAWPES